LRNPNVSSSHENSGEKMNEITNLLQSVKSLILQETRITEEQQKTFGKTAFFDVMAYRYRDIALQAIELSLLLAQEKTGLVKKSPAEDCVDKKQNQYSKKHNEALQYIKSCNGMCTKTMLTKQFNRWKTEERKKIFRDLIETGEVEVVFEKGIRRPIGYVRIVKS
jgi:hypothetical protein